MRLAAFSAALLLLLGGCPSVQSVHVPGTNIRAGVYNGLVNLTIECRSPRIDPNSPGGNAWGDSIPTDMTFELTSDGRIFINGFEYYEGATNTISGFTSVTQDVSITADSIHIRSVTNYSNGLGDGSTSWLFTRIDDQSVEIRFSSYSIRYGTGTPCDGVGVGILSVYYSDQGN